MRFLTKKKTITLTCTIWKCNKTDEQFEVYHLVGPGIYGELILQARNLDLAYWNNLHDAAFDEVRKIVDEFFGAGVTDKKYAALDQVTGLCCDPAPDGSVYRERPYCPSCGDNDVSFWDVPEPFKFKTVRIPVVTHKHWNRLTSEQREKLVRDDLKISGLL